MLSGRHGARLLWSYFRILSDLPEEFEVVAINDLYENKALAYLLKYDTVMGTFDKDVRHDDEALHINDKKVLMTNHRDPAEANSDVRSNIRPLPRRRWVREGVRGMGAEENGASRNSVWKVIGCSRAWL